MKPITIALWAGIVLLSACSNGKKTPLINESASLPASFKFNTSGLKLKASFINKRSGSMSVLYTRSEALTLVTWKQKSDENWFGANIPGGLLSVETVKTNGIAPALPADYNYYNNKGILIKQDAAWQQKRISYIISRQPSVMP